eukprot:scaffold1988_cov255-Pinguiococcus_pyrenoidosus.AAC.13
MGKLPGIAKRCSVRTAGCCRRSLAVGLTVSRVAAVHEGWIRFDSLDDLVGLLPSYGGVERRAFPCFGGRQHNLSPLILSDRRL